jgi:hypothetical protein
MKKKNTHALPKYFEDSEFGWKLFWDISFLVIVGIFLFPFWLLGRIANKWYYKRGN